MSDAELAEIEARAKAATEGPWWVHEDDQRQDRDIDDDGYWHKLLIANPGEIDGHLPYYIAEIDLLSCGDDGNAVDYVNATFIAHARTDITKLLAEVRRLRAAQAGLCDGYDCQPAECRPEAALACGCGVGDPANCTCDRGWSSAEQERLAHLTCQPGSTEKGGDS